ncbi:hypothetical protein [Cellulomonas soli]
MNAAVLTTVLTGLTGLSTERTGDLVPPFDGGGPTVSCAPRGDGGTMSR